MHVDPPGTLLDRIDERLPMDTVAYVVMAHVVMAWIVMAYVVVAYIVMACIVMADVVITYVVMAYSPELPWHPPRKTFPKKCTRNSKKRTALRQVVNAWLRAVAG